MVASSDFWELPASRRTGAVTDVLEKNYYSRCPPEKRPFFMCDTASPSEKDEKNEATEDPTNPATPATYEESLFKAILQTFKRRIWASSLLLLASGAWSTFYLNTNRFKLSQDNDTYPPQSLDYLAGRVVCLFSPLRR
jgi:hypothetical protein